MDISQSLQNLLNGTATEKEIQLLKQLLAVNEISIGGNVSQSVIIIGDGNTVELTPQALDRLGGRLLLGNLERDLTGDEIGTGLNRLEAELQLRAPILLTQFQEQTRRLRPTLKTNPNTLGESLRKERLEALAHINSLCMEALDISFNALATGETPPEYEARCPFRGLESFRVEDREFFFGREELTKKLTAKIQTHPFLAVLGASGSGKSSLVMAGMIPALDLDYAIIRPGTTPLDALDSARGKSLLVVDQFEELFTLSRDEKTRADFISALLDSTKSGRVIITLRSDFLGEAGAYRSLSAEIQNHLEIVPPMNADELRRATEGQARWARLEFEADLSQQILDDVAGEPGAMPLLQHALWELWNRRHGRHLRAHEYRAFGGVKQAITSTAEKVHGDCSKPEQEQVRDIFLRLTRLDEGDEGRDTRRRVPLGDLIPSGADVASISALLDKLADARLIVKTVQEDVTEIEVAHEALIRHWERLRIWLNEDRDYLRLRESVSESAKEWGKSGRHESLLNSRWVKLDEALLLAQDSRYRLTEIEQAYLSGCLELRNREQRERERRLRYTVFASIAAAILFLALGSFGLVKSNEATSQAATAQANANDAATAQANAEKQTNIAVSKQLAALSKDHLETEPDLGMLLAIESHNSFDTSQSRNAMLSNLMRFSKLKEYIWNKEDTATAIAYNLRQKTLAIASSGGTISFWDTENNKYLEALNQGEKVNRLAFDPDGQILAIYDDNGDLTILDMNTKKVVRILSGINVESVLDLKFSNDGSVLALIDKKHVAVWNTKDFQHLAPIDFGQGVIKGVSFSPDGHLLAIAGCESGYPGLTVFATMEFCEDKGISVWDASTGKKIKTFDLPNPPLMGTIEVKFNPKGNSIAISTQTDVYILDIVTGEKNQEFTSDYQNGSEVTHLTFDANGETLYIVTSKSVGADPMGFLQSTLIRLNGDGSTYRFDYPVFPTDVIYLPQADGIATLNIKGTVTLFQPQLLKNDLIQSYELPDSFSPDGTIALSPDMQWVAYSPRGAWYQILISNLRTSSFQKIDLNDNVKGYITSLTLNNNGVLAVGIEPLPDDFLDHVLDHNIVMLFDTKTGKSLSDPIKGHYPFFSPNGETLAITDSDQGIKIIQLLNLVQFTLPLPKQVSVLDLVFSPDGKNIAVIRSDGVANVWNLESRKIAEQIAGVDSKSKVFFTANGAFLTTLDSETSNCDGMQYKFQNINGEESNGYIPLFTDFTLSNVAYCAHHYVTSPDMRLIALDPGFHLAFYDVESKIFIGSLWDDIYFPNGRFSKDGKFFWIINKDLQIAIVDPVYWRHLLCNKVNRNLTNQEWQTFFPNEPYRETCTTKMLNWLTPIP